MLALYHSPGACSRSALILLEQAGADYELRLARIAAGENKSEAYLRVNPNGKVPALVHEGRVLTENVAISSYLAYLFPQAGLLPSQQADAWAHAQALSWLAWGATGLHPTLGRARNAQAFIEGEAAQAGLRTHAIAQLQSMLQIADAHLRDHTWFAGERWTAPDAYLFYVLTRAVEIGIDLAVIPSVQSHYERMRQEPAVKRALEREAAAIAQVA